MDPRVEVQPDNTLIVLGPHFAASLVQEDEEEKDVSTLHPLSYTELAEVFCNAQSSDGESLVKKWLERYVQGIAIHRSSLLERLLELQREGALIVYGYIDQTVCTAAQQTALKAEQAEDWASGKAKGILHPFGVCDDPESVRLDMLPECAVCLNRLLQERACLLLGYNGMDTHHKPYAFIQQMCNETRANVPLSLISKATCNWNDISPTLLQLPVPDPTAAEVVCRQGNDTRKLGQLLEAPSKTTTKSSRRVTLIIDSKEGAMEIAVLVKGASFVFMNTVNYSGLTLYPLCVRIDNDKFSEFWRWLVSEEGSQSLIDLGGMGVVLHNGTYIWFNSCKTISTLIAGEARTSVFNSEASSLLKAMSSPDKPQRDEHQSSRKSSPQKSSGRTIPRYTIQRFSPRNGFMNKFRDAAQDDSSDLLKAPASILARRLSLPPVKHLPQANLAKLGALVPTDFIASTRHTSLLSKFIFGRKRGGVPVGNLGSKTIKQLLEKKSEDTWKEKDSRDESLSPKLDTNKDGATILREMTIKRRRDLFVGEGRDWSTEVDGILVKMTKRWESTRRARMVAMMARKQEADQASKDNLMEGELGGTRQQQHVSNHPMALPSVAAYTNGLSASSYMTGVNPYLLSQSAASMLYPNFLSTYPALLSTVNNFPYLLPSGQAVTAGMLLMPNGTGVAIPTSTSSGFKATSVSPPIVTRPQSPARPPQVAGIKRPAQQSTLQQTYPNISSLLQSSHTSSHTSPPPAKLHRKSMPSHTIHTNGTSDENSKQLWQFFLELLLSGSTYSHLLKWTGSNLEFKIENPEGLAELWGHLTMNKALDINHLNQALYHYCTNTTILSQVTDQEATFRFHSNIATYISTYIMRKQNGSTCVNNSNTAENYKDYKEILVVVD